MPVRRSDTEIAIDTEVGKRLQCARTARNITRRDLADELGVSYQQINKYETGQDRIAVSRLITIANFLGMSVSSLIVGLSHTDKHTPGVTCNGQVEKGQAGWP